MFHFKIIQSNTRPSGKERCPVEVTGIHFPTNVQIVLEPERISDSSSMLKFHCKNGYGMGPCCVKNVLFLYP